MQRAVTILVVPVLLVATGGAFLAAEALKLAKPPIRVPVHGFLGARFSPVCGPTCPTRAAVVRFALVKPGRLAVAVVGPGGATVRSLVPERDARGVQTVRWDGRDDRGQRAPDGVYHLRLRLRGRSYQMPNAITIDTVAPSLTLTLRHPTFTPDGDGRADRVAVGYRAGEQLFGRTVVRGRRVLRSGVTLRALGDGGRVRWTLETHRHSTHGTEFWNGLVAGRIAPAGPYRLTVSGHDLAGNAVESSVTATLAYEVPAPATALSAGQRGLVRGAHRLGFALYRPCTPAPVASGGRGQALPDPLIPADARGGLYVLRLRVPSGRFQETLLPVRAARRAAIALLVPARAAFGDLRPWLVRLDGQDLVYDAITAGDAASSELLSGYRTLYAPGRPALTAQARRTYAATGGSLVTRAPAPVPAGACQVPR